MSLIPAPRPRPSGDVTLPQTYPEYGLTVRPSYAVGYQYQYPLQSTPWQWAPTSYWYPDAQAVACPEEVRVIEEEESEEEEKETKDETEETEKVTKGAVIQQSVVQMPSAPPGCYVPYHPSYTTIIHYCGRCKKPRSRGYHRNHPVSIDHPIEQGICGKCKRKSRRYEEYDGMHDHVRVSVRETERRSRGRSPPGIRRVTRYHESPGSRLSEVREPPTLRSSSRTRITIQNRDSSSDGRDRGSSRSDSFSDEREYTVRRNFIRRSSSSPRPYARYSAKDYNHREVPTALRGGAARPTPSPVNSSRSSKTESPLRSQFETEDARSRLASHPMPFRYGRPVYFEDESDTSPHPRPRQASPPPRSSGPADTPKIAVAQSQTVSTTKKQTPESRDEKSTRPPQNTRRQRSSSTERLYIRSERSHTRGSTIEVAAATPRGILRPPSRQSHEAISVKRRVGNLSGESTEAQYGGRRVSFSGEPTAVRRTSGITESSAMAFGPRRRPQHGTDASLSSREDFYDDPPLNVSCKVCDAILQETVVSKPPTKDTTYDPYSPPPHHVVERSTYHRPISRHRSPTRTRRGRTRYRESSPIPYDNESPTPPSKRKKLKKVSFCSLREPSSSRRLQSPPPAGQPWNRIWDSESSDEGSIQLKKKPSVVEFRCKRRDGVIERWIEVREEVKDQLMSIERSRSTSEHNLPVEWDDRRLQSVERGRRTGRERHH